MVFPLKIPSFGTQPYGPISDTIPVISWLYLFKGWHLLPPDEAFHFPLILYGSIGILIVYYLTKEAFGSLPALFSATFLALYPRYIGHIHNNMKDPPSAITIALAIFLFLKFIKSLKLSTPSSTFYHPPPSSIFYLLSSSFAVGLAFNTKVNAILIPPIIIAWLLLSYRDQIKLHVFIPVISPPSRGGAEIPPKPALGRKSEDI